MGMLNKEEWDAMTLNWIRYNNGVVPAVEATHRIRRALSLARLVRAGKIYRDEDDPMSKYPNIVYRIVGEDG